MVLVPARAGAAEKGGHDDIAVDLPADDDTAGLEAYVRALRT